MRHRKRAARERPVAIGYGRVSTDQQVNSGLGLGDQERRIREECERRGWELLEIAIDPGLSGREMRKRPALLAALERLDAGEVDVLVVTKVDRLARSVRDLADMMERSDRRGWALVAVDQPVDTSNVYGRAQVQMAGVFAELESGLISDRTKSGLAEARARGAKLGRFLGTDPKVRARIRRLRSRGWTWQRIADRLNENGVPTPQGGREWRPSSVAAAHGRS